MPKKTRPLPTDPTTPLTTEDVATLMRCSAQHVRVLFRDGRIPGGLRYGPRLIRFDQPTVRRWLAAQTVTA